MDARGGTNRSGSGRGASVGIVAAHPVLASAAITALLFTIVLATLTPGYRTNDDPAMALRVAGIGRAAAPSEYILNSNVLVGHALSALHTRWPHAPWYGLYLVACHVLATFALLAAVLRLRASATRALLFLAYFVALGLDHVLRLQFTTTAFLLAQSGVFLFLAAVADARSARPPWRLLLASGALLLLGGLVRMRSLELALVLASPAVVVTLARHVRAAALGRCAAMAAGTALALVLVQSVDRAAYARDPGWERFYQYKKAKAQIIDFKNVYYDATTRPRFDRIGWSENDFRMMMTWFYADYERYSLAKIRALLAGFPSHKASLDTVAQALPALLGAAREPLLVALALMLFARRRATIFLHVLLAAAALAACAWLVYYMKAPPPRVYLSAIALLAAAGVFFAEREPWDRARPWSTVVSALALVLALAGGRGLVVAHLDASRENAHNARALHRILAALEPRPHELYVVWGRSFPWKWASPFADLPRLYEGLRTVGIGVSLSSPLTQEQLTAHGIGDLYRGLVERDDVFLVLRHPGPPRLALYQRYMHEHYRLWVGYERLVQTQPFAIYRLFARPVDGAA